VPLKYRRRRYAEGEGMLRVEFKKNYYDYNETAHSQGLAEGKTKGWAAGVG